MARLARPKLRCTFVGRGSAREAAETKARALGLSGVSFLDWAAPEELARRIASATAVVLPSFEESFGNTMAESLAVGAPLITSRVGSIPEIVQDGRTGWLVPPNDPAALAEALQQVLDHPVQAAERGARGRQDMLERFSWAKTAQRYAELYDAP